MASNIRNQFVFNQNTKTTLLDGYESTVDAVGTLLNGTFSGGTISHVSAGTYDLLLDQGYGAFLSMSGTIHSQNVRTGYQFEIQWHNVSNNVDSFGNAARTIRFSFLNGNTATDLPANSGFDLTVLLKDSPLKPGA